MRSSIRIVAAACALLMITLAFQTVGARANPPTAANEFNHALASNGGVAATSGYSGTNAPGKAIDASPSTYWQSSTTTGWLAVAFSPKADVNEVHIHFLSGSAIYSSLSLYLDKNANGVYETSEKVWSVKNNGVRDVIVPLTKANALGMQVTIDAKSGSNQPKIAEFEAYLRDDSDGDGLTNTQETSTIYFQDKGAGGLPLTVPNDGTNSASISSSLIQFYGNGVGALANFTVDHARKTDLTAQIGYWNGSAWVDRYVWDPGRRLDKVTITQPSVNSYLTGAVTVVAAVEHPEVTSKVEFRVGGQLQATLTTPVGNNFQWSWNTASFAEGSTKLNATQYDALGAKAWSEITVYVVRPPTVTWVAPANGAVVSGVVNVRVTATSWVGIEWVEFYVDGMYKYRVTSPNDGANGYLWPWSTSQYCTNGQHTLKAVATANGPLYLQTSPSVTVTTNQVVRVCITSPGNGAYVSGTVVILADAATLPGTTISKVDFYIGGSLWSTDTTAPYASNAWDTTATSDGTYTLAAIATNSAGNTAQSTITIHVSNPGGGGGCRTPPCPQGPTNSTDATPQVAGATSPPTTTLGILTTEWSRGEVDSGSKAIVVVDLVSPQSSASPGEISSRILRPSFPSSYFATYLHWHLVIRDWNTLVDCIPHGDPSCEFWPAPGQMLTFTLRFEAASDPLKPDTDGDGISDGTEATVLGTLPVARDSDADGLSDDYEIAPHSLTLTINGVTTTLAPFTTLPTNSDTDGDGLSDGEERSIGMDRVVTDPLKQDTDNDGLWDGPTVGTHLGELSYNANATLTDTDGDTFSDWTEVNPRSMQLIVNGATVTRSVATLPYSTDSDGDGLKDNEEWYGTSVYGVKTDPSAADTDADGLADGQERYMKELAMPTRKPVGLYVSVPLSISIAGSVEKVTLSYGLSTIDVSHFYVTLSLGGTTVLVRSYQGSGLFNFSSIDLPSSMWSGGTYTLQVSSTASGGILERFRIMFTIRTSPIRTDTDGDGLNDSEETTAGQDGWVTDPNMYDTDGDTWTDAYEISRATNPLSVDTDGDGARDNVDLDPLRNLLVKVTVNKIHHGASPWCSPEMVGIVRVNDAYAWVTQHVVAGEEPFTSFACPPPIPTTQMSTSSFGMSYYADVPDDVSTFNLRMTAWAINPGRGDDILVDQPLTYALNSPIPPQTVWNGNSWISFDVSTFGLEKSKAFLITDGQVTVNSAAGQTRMAGPDRFFVFTFDLSSAWSPFVYGINTVLVPRSVFLDSKLEADFAAGSYYPLSNAPLYGDDITKASISDGVAGVVATSLTADQANDVLSRLLMNAAGAWSHSYVDITSQALVANLPLDVVKILPWQAVYNGPTGAMPQDFWSKIGAIATTVVNTLIYVGQLIYKGLVALGTFLADIAQAIADWGMKAIGQVWNAAVAVAQATANALGRLADWIVNMALNAITGAISALVNSVKSLMDKTLGAFVRELEAALAEMDMNKLANTLASLAELLLVLAVALAMIPVAIRVAFVAFKALTVGVSWLVETAISEGVAQFLVRVLMGIAFSLATTALLTVILDTMGWVEDTTAAFFKTLGLAVGAIAGVTKVVFKLYESVFLKTANDISLVQRYKGFALSLLGLAVVIYASGTYAQKGPGRLAADMAGFAFQAFGFWLYTKSSKDPLVQIADFAAPVGAAIEHGVVVLSVPVSVAKIAANAQSGGYN